MGHEYFVIVNPILKNTFVLRPFLKQSQIILFIYKFNSSQILLKHVRHARALQLVQINPKMYGKTSKQPNLLVLNQVLTFTKVQQVQIVSSISKKLWFLQINSWIVHFKVLQKFNIAMALPNHLIAQESITIHQPEQKNKKSETKGNTYKLCQS